MSDPEPSLAFDDVVIDVAGRRLLRGGIEQALEPKAFAVLVLLASAPGQVFTRDDILDTVWGHHHLSPGVLNRVMTLLRHALGEDAQGARYLHTVHGVGYRFDLPESGPLAAPVPEIETESQPAAPVLPIHRDVDNLPRRIARMAVWVLPLLAVLAFTGWKFWPRATNPAAIERSVAVLPLANASRDPDQQFFSDGLSENLIDALSRFEGLKVVGRVSSFRYRDSKDDSKHIGAELGAAYLLSGSVQRAGDVVRVSTTLTRAADGSTLWAEHYDRPYKDLFALQDEIANAIAEALKTKLQSPRAATRDNRPASGNVEAYNAYLHGMQFFYQSNYPKVIEYQELATRLDPGYAAAWAQLSVAWALMGYDAIGAQKQLDFRNSRTAVDKALALDPELGIAHGALGNLLLGADFAWDESISEFRRGAALEPGNGPINGGLSRALAASGNLRSAMVYRQRSMSIEPLAAYNYTNYADLLIAAGRLDEAESNLRLAQGLKGEPVPPSKVVHISMLRGDATAALAAATRQPLEWRDANAMLALQIGSDRAAADAALTKGIANKDLVTRSPYFIAQTYAARGDPGKTVEWLDRAWNQRDVGVHHVLYDPLILRFRTDARLIAFCRKVGLPPPSSSEALSLDQIRASLAAKG